MTNGEKLKEVFPDIQIFNVTENEQREKFIHIRLGGVCQAIELDWWSAEYKEPTKNDLGVDCISRADVLHILLDYDYANENALVLKDIKALPSVIPQLSSGLDKNSKKLEKNFGESDDCISRQAVLEQAYAYGNGLEPDGYCVNVEDIQALPSVTPQEPRWIPVSEYLPVTNDEILVTYIVNGNTKKRYVETANCFDGEWSSINDEYRIPNTRVEIIAWMPLPKAYKEVKE